MSLEDLKLQIDTTLSTTEKDFRLGEQRVLAVLFFCSPLQDRDQIPY